jgi:hypothetical protein
VETTTLDAFFAREGWPPLQLIKMDIEGSEGAALRGMKQLLTRNPHIDLVIECNAAALRRAGGTPASLTADLLELGFEEGHLIEERLASVQLTESLPTRRTTYNVLLVK